MKRFFMGEIFFMLKNAANESPGAVKAISADGVLMLVDV